jgi:formylglycine-generating enzyme required for sulfatase activity
VADPAFPRLEAHAVTAERAWNEGDWPGAERLFALAQEGLDLWLEGRETPAEFAKRREADGATALAIANRERALRAEVTRLEGIEKALASQVQGLHAQIARLTEQNLRDRDAQIAATKNLNGERKARAAAESERDEARRDTLAKGTELAARDAVLKTALADLKTWKARALSAGSTANIREERHAATTPGWQGASAGDVKVVQVHSQEIRFRWCPAGLCKMDFGDLRANVTLTRGFWMLETEVTQGLWEAVMGAKLDWATKWSDPNLPVYNVDYGEAEEFGVKLTALLRDSGQLPSDMTVGLPTEAQWVYAARAGTTAHFSFGDDHSALGHYAWYGKTSGGKPHRVARLQPNPWGLYDTAGNVWEWCADRRGDWRRILGGGWDCDAESCGPAAFSNFTLDYRSPGLGFRLAAVQE